MSGGGSNLVVYTVNRRDFSAPDYYKVLQAEGYAAKGDSVRAEILVDEAEPKKSESMTAAGGGGVEGSIGGIASSPLAPQSPGSFRKASKHFSSNVRGVAGTTASVHDANSNPAPGSSSSGRSAAAAAAVQEQQKQQLADRYTTTRLPNPIARQVVIRKFHQVCRDQQSLRALLRVIKLQAALGEANQLDGILPLIDCYRPRMSQEDVYCATPAVECTLSAAIYSVESLEPRHILTIAHELALALRMLHAHGIVLADLKPDTIGLMTRLGMVNSVCISDLSIVHRVGETCEDLEALPSWKMGTLRYRAPEFALEGVSKLSPAADMWSLGVVIAEMIARRPLFSCSDYISYVREVTNFIGTPQSAATLDFFTNEHAKKFVLKLAPKPAAPMTTVVPSNVSKPLLVEIQKLLRWDPATRTTAELFLKSPVFEQFGDISRRTAPPPPPVSALQQQTHKVDGGWAIGSDVPVADMLAQLDEYCVTME